MNKNCLIMEYSIENRGENYSLIIANKKIIAHKFLVKNNDLFIFSNEYNTAFILKNLPAHIIENIKAGKCLLIEKNQNKSVSLVINLHP